MISLSNTNRSEQGGLPYLLLILVSFVALQLWNVSYRWVDDESWYTMPVPSISHGEFNIPTVPGDDRFWPQPPVLTYLESALNAFVPINPTSARSIPLLFGVATIIAAFLLTRRLGGVAAASLASAFVAADNLVFLASRTVRPEILVAFSLLGALYFLMPLLLGKEWRFRDVVYVALASALGLWSHPNGLILPMTVCVLVVLSGAMTRKIQFLAGFLAFYSLAMLPFAAWIAHYDMASDFSSFKGHWFKRYARQASGGSAWDVLWRLLSGEFNGRYKDFLQAPYRVHVGVLSAVLIGVGIFSRRLEYRLLAVTAILQLLFFIFVNNSNPTVRYMATFTPVVAVLAALYAARLLWPGDQSRSSGGVVAGALILATFLVSQAAGNALYIWKYRDADFVSVAARVNKLIPDGSVVYGGMFWWPQMRQHTLVPYIRTPWAEAVTRWKPNYVVMDDWVMTGGGEKGAWHALRAEIDQYLLAHGAKMVGEVDGGFYGRLRVFSVTH